VAVEEVAQTPTPTALPSAPLPSISAEKEARRARRRRRFCKVCKFIWNIMVVVFYILFGILWFLSQCDLDF